MKTAALIALAVLFSGCGPAIAPTKIIRIQEGSCLYCDAHLTRADVISETAYYIWYRHDDVREAIGFFCRGEHRNTVAHD